MTSLLIRVYAPIETGEGKWNGGGESDRKDLVRTRNAQMPWGGGGPGVRGTISGTPTVLF